MTFDDQDTSDGGPRLARPVLITGVGPAAAGVLRRLSAELHASARDLAVVQLSSATAANTDDGDARRLSPGDLPRLVRDQFQQSPLATVDRLSWIGIVGLERGEDESGPTPEQILADTVLPCAAELYMSGRRLALTLVLLDSRDATEQLETTLRDLALQASASGLAPALQVYVLKAERSTRFVLGPDDLQAYGHLAVLGLVLANLCEAPPELASDLLVPRAIDANRDEAGESPRIFGRIAVQRLVSQSSMTATHCAESCIAEFAAKATDGALEVEVGWQPAQVTLVRPEISQADKGRIGAAIRGGARVRLVGPPALWGDTATYVNDMRECVEAWAEGLVAWRREVRVTFATVLRDLRRASALESERARNAVDEEVGALWADTSLPGPTPYIKEFLEIQRKRWSEAVREQSAGRGPIRGSTTENVRSRMAGRLKCLEDELARRPNLTMMLSFALVALAGGIWLLWQNFDALGASLPPLPGLGLIQGGSAAVARFITLALVSCWAGAVVATVLLGTRLRWHRAYRELNGPITSISVSEARALEREIDIVDAHWYVKALASGIQHAERVESRLDHLEADLQDVGPPVPRRGGERQALTRYVPENGRAAAEELALTQLMTADRVAGLLRSRAMAQRWLADPETWTRHAAEALRAEFQSMLADPEWTVESRTVVSLKSILDEWESDALGQGLAATYLAQAASDGGSIEPRRHAMFVTGYLGAVVDQIPMAPRVDLVKYASARDEVLLMVAQPGLDAGTAAS